MKRLLLLGLLIGDLGAKEWKIKGNDTVRSERFMTQDVQLKKRTLQSNASSSPCYYKSGIVSDKTCYRQTGNILVTFGKGSSEDFKAYAKRHNLQFLRLLNPLYQTVLFSAKAHKEELIELVNTLNEKGSAARARVEWVSPRRVR